MKNISIKLLLYVLLPIQSSFRQMGKSLKLNGSNIQPSLSKAPIFTKLCLINTKKEFVRELSNIGDTGVTFTVQTKKIKPSAFGT